VNPPYIAVIVASDVPTTEVAPLTPQPHGTSGLAAAPSRRTALGTMTPITTARRDQQRRDHHRAAAAPARSIARSASPSTMPQSRWHRERHAGDQHDLPSRAIGTAR
jgi:hypothetical protein